MPIYQRIPHPHLLNRRPPPRVRDMHVGFNGRVALIITEGVGTMWCAYAFAALALVSLPSAIRSGDPVVLVSWISQTFLQLVLLSIIIVGQNIQARASDKRAASTYEDAETILRECMELQAHLQAQDEVLERLISEVTVPPRGGGGGAAPASGAQPGPS